MKILPKKAYIELYRGKYYPWYLRTPQRTVEGFFKANQLLHST